MLVCAGRQSNTDIDLAAAGIIPEPSRPRAESTRIFRRSCRIYAAGGVIGRRRWRQRGSNRRASRSTTAFEASIQERSRVVSADRDHRPEGPAWSARESLTRDGIECIVGRAHYADIARGEIIGDQTGFLKLIFRREGMKLLGVHVMGEQATEVIHIGLMALLAEAGAEVFNRACFNFPTLGDLSKYATYHALAQRDAPA